MRPSARPAPIVEVFTGQQLATIPIGTAQDAKDAIARARVAQKEWAATARPPSAPRSSTATATWCSKNLDSLMDMAQAETGKSRDAAQEEVLDIAMTARHYAASRRGCCARSGVTGMLPGLTKTVGAVPAQGRRRRHLAVELPAGAGGVRRDRRADGRQRASCSSPTARRRTARSGRVELLYEAGPARGLFQIVTGAGLGGRHGDHRAAPTT